LLFLKPDFNEQHHTDFKKFRVIRERCNSKACPHCSRLYFNRIRRRLDDVYKFHNWRFFTLTSINTEDTHCEKLAKLENDFRELRKKLKRKFPDLQYIAVKEMSPSGMWHYHGLWNVYIDIKTLSRYWQEISGAYRVSLEKVRNPAGAINYIFKYCFKSITNETERRILYESDKRKFTTSRGLLDKRSNPNPYTCEVGVSYDVEEIKEKLYSVISTSQCTIDDFSGSDYPYFDDLIFNLFFAWANEHPPDLFTSDQYDFSECLGSAVC
jgi:hypothetical protein